MAWFRTFWFQLHWFFGITAGIVLVVVGVTGGMLSFQSEILRAINPGVMTVTPGTQKLAPSELLDRLQHAFPGRQIQSITLYDSANDAAQVGIASADPAQRRGENRYVNPYTGEVLGEPRGTEFFRTVMQLHRWLLTDQLLDNRDIGKHIVGASTVFLIVLCISGIYLRWPRHAANLKTWLTFKWSRKGRGFLWDIHAVLGTWAVLLYVLASFTGLYWSYEWYRNGLHDISGVPRAVRAATPAPAEGAADAAASGEARRQGGERTRGDGQGQRTAASAPSWNAIDGVWIFFLSQVDGYSRAQIRLPQRTGQDISITYLDASPAHERAANRITINSAGDEVVSHDRYADRPLNVRLMNSMLPLHAGSYFGTIGKVLMMIASIAMPLFTITGWMLYLNRRRHKSEAHHAMETAQAIRTVHHNEPVLIAYATQSGYAESLAWHTANVLLQHGQPVTVKSLGDMVPEDLSQYRNALLLISTFGDGEPPTDAEAFAEAMAQSAALAPLRYGLLALGDREYEQYCAFGRAVDIWLQKSGATHLFESIELDGEDAAALELWYHQVSSHVEVEEK